MNTAKRYSNSDTTKESSNMWTKITLTHYLMVTKVSILCRSKQMVPQLSALSLALCYEALVGGGNHRLKPASQKETSHDTMHLYHQMKTMD